MKQTTSLVICTLVLCAGVTWAGVSPPPADTLKVDYFSNANTAGAPDGTLRLTNPGGAGGSVWADIYVFDPQQELTECCSCRITPDGLRTLSVNTDLTSNPLTGVTLATGAIKIVSATGNNAARITPTAGGVRSWTTHIQNSNFAITETASQDATFSAVELTRLDNQCFAIHLDGSGKGICSCGVGD
jgi:hypothetical protein